MVLWICGDGYASDLWCCGSGVMVMLLICGATDCVAGSASGICGASDLQ